MAHTGGNIVLHLIFSTKGRRPLIGGDIRQQLFGYLGGIVREMRGTALIINGTADHVHMLVRIRPAQSAAEVVRVVKANSCRWVHEKWKMRFAWQTGYGVFSVSESNVPTVSRYIADQEKHHRTKTFQEEYVAFLKKTTSRTMSGTCGIDAVVSFVSSGLWIFCNPSARDGENRFSNVIRDGEETPGRPLNRDSNIPQSHVIGEFSKFRLPDSTARDWRCSPSRARRLP